MSLLPDPARPLKAIFPFAPGKVAPAEAGARRASAASVRVRRVVVTRVPRSTLLDPR
jgi:hypothetical protein